MGSENKIKDQQIDSKSHFFIISIPCYTYCMPQ